MSGVAMPSKQIASVADLRRWEHSNGKRDFVGFLRMMSDAVKGCEAPGETGEHPLVEKLNSILDELAQAVTNFPPRHTGAQRFGDPAFRDWHAFLQEQAAELCKRLLPESLLDEESRWHEELACYLRDAFGNAQRIDYGTGHELHFFVLLYALGKLRILTPDMLKSVALRVVPEYLRVVRLVQRTYLLEPAGSRGAHGLDDYQFLPFYLGASQLIGKENTVKPSCAENQELMRQLADRFLYCAAVDYIHRCKTGPFFEHSHALYNIGGVPLWSKVNTGLLRMYETEVLGRFPIVQHLLFGRLLALE
ncbi:MAG: hypothetical protein MHM6MM_003139 [Cercozoa sp. M6MM]